MPGQYTIPFSFLLPDHLPGSFSMVKKQFSAEISYKIKAEIMLKNNIKYKATVPYTIKQAITEQRFSVSYEKSTEVIRCRCVNKGICTIKAHLDKNAYTPSETAKITVEIDNSHCSVPIKAIECTL